MKRLIQFILYSHFFILSLFAQVQVSAPSNFTQNESYYFTIEASGENVQFPKISKIDNFVVQEAGQSRSITNINGVISAKYIKRYQLYPTKDFTLPSFQVQIDGQDFQTKSLQVKKIKREQTTSKYFTFNLSSSKKELYVGESTVLTLQFKHRRDVKIMDYNLNLSSFENFWHKSLEKNRQYQEGDFIIQELDFLLFPQKSGKLSIAPVNIEVVVLDMNNAYTFFGNNTKKIKIYSNELFFDVKALPSHTTLVGQFDIKATVDKTSIKEGENINFKVEVNGVGNIDDVQDITLNIPNTTIYENKAVVNAKVENNRYQGSYVKSFSLLPSSDITIPSISLNYFDLKSQSIQSIQTKAYNISVLLKQKASAPVKLQKKTEPAVIKEKVVVQSSLSDKILFFILGCMVSILSIGLYFYVINKKDKKQQDSSLEQLIKKAKNKEDIIRCLLPYLDNNNDIKQLVFKLEKENDSQLKQYKKELLLIIKKYHIKG